MAGMVQLLQLQVGVQDYIDVHCASSRGPFPSLLNLTDWAHEKHASFKDVLHIKHSVPCEPDLKAVSVYVCRMSLHD